jgi:hypothetical protein
MKLVYTHENKMLAENAKNMLELAGIDSHLKNEFASGAAGDLVPSESWPEVWIRDDSDYDKALSILKVLSDKLTGEDWRCDACQETNAATFEICWNCQTERVIK